MRCVHTNCSELRLHGAHLAPKPHLFAILVQYAPIPVMIPDILVVHCADVGNYKNAFPVTPFNLFTKQFDFQMRMRHAYFCGVIRHPVVAFCEYVMELTEASFKTAAK